MSRLKKAPTDSSLFSLYVGCISAVHSHYSLLVNIHESVKAINEYLQWNEQLCRTQDFGFGSGSPLYDGEMRMKGEKKKMIKSNIHCTVRSSVEGKELFCTISSYFLYELLQENSIMKFDYGNTGRKELIHSFGLSQGLSFSFFSFEKQIPKLNVSRWMCYVCIDLRGNLLSPCPYMSPLSNSLVLFFTTSFH